MSLKQNLHNFKEKNKDKKWLPGFNALFTFLYMPNETTHNGTHIKAADDLKRTMNTVIMALVPCLIFGMFNAGYQHYLAQGLVESADGFLGASFWTWDNLVIGLWKVLPLVVVSYGVGLAVEFVFAIIKGHEVEEGYLVTGMLVPLIVPVDIPLWMLSVAVIFGVVIGKEVFGGTGMNILNPALTIRAFLFFAYPTWMSGDKVWVHGATAAAGTPDAYSGETILGTYAANNPVDYSVWDMFWGIIPGSVGEVSALAIMIGGLALIYFRIASWRIVGGVALGVAFFSSLLNLIGSDTNPMFAMPFYWHMVIGGMAFGMFFMATDPVSASFTNQGKWAYGIFIGLMTVLIRVINPAFPEGIMLAILFANLWAPLFDYFVAQSNIKRRIARVS